MHDDGRPLFRQLLAALEDDVQAMAVAAQRQFELSIVGLSGGDPEVYRRVIAGDDEIDDYYLRVERQIVALYALQSPVWASDLRLLTALVHVNGHLERVGDMAVNIAKIGESAHSLPRSSSVLERLEEMGGIALRMLEAAMIALARRDAELSRRLTIMDERVDLLNRGMLPEVLDAAGDRGLLAWCVDMHLVSRQVERVGDHAVDIGEQVAYLVTGEFEEFTDASHPEVEHPDLRPAQGPGSGVSGGG
ncbi:MAG TPA: phosphate signaling complex protein PhoU [Actinomycetota bacterium]|nr:phosphate signaling complex protein PhoU [Actinomycetota bacterium]